MDKGVKYSLVIICLGLILGLLYISGSSVEVSYQQVREVLENQGDGTVRAQLKVIKDPRSFNWDE